jgi:pSer/pThr/pTyr-binding forkhead associated (FHA) protein
MTETATHKARLLIHHPEGDSTYALTRDNIVLGRVESADVVLADPTVSRVHARVVFLEDAHFIMDLQSRTGTQVNGNAVDDYGVALKDGDNITVGAVKLRYQRPT